MRAPKKTFEFIPGAGHNTFALTPQLLALLDKDVRPLVVLSLQR